MYVCMYVYIYILPYIFHPESRSSVGRWYGAVLTYARRKCTRECALQIISGPVQKGFWSGQSSVLYRENRAATPEGAWKRTRRGEVHDKFSAYFFGAGHMGSDANGVGRI